jgi:hypothetical protein
LAAGVLKADVQTAPGADQLVVDLTEKRPLQRQARGYPDTGARHGKEDEDPSDESGPEGPTAKPPS